MTCKDCKDKTCLKTGKPCAKIELYLRSQGIKGADWIRPRMPSTERGRRGSKYREIPFSSLGLENKEKKI